MNEGSTKWIVIGVIALIIIIKVGNAFGDTRSDAQDERDAAVFGDPAKMPVLWDSQAFTHYLAKFPPDRQLRITATVKPRLEAVGKSIALLQVAPGVFNDDERAAVGAITSLSSWPEALWFAQTFPMMTGGVTVGAWLKDNFGEDVQAQVVRHLTNLERTYTPPA